MTTNCTTINVSVKWLTKLFNCTPKFIKDTCKGKCCQGANKIMVSIALDEIGRHDQALIDGGKLIPDKRGLCPYKNDNGLCNVHLTERKPWGCRVSPFTVNKNGTLIVRHRYIHMPCYGSGEPAYEAFSPSLVMLFGLAQTGRIIKDIQSGADQVTAYMNNMRYEKLIALDNIKKGDK